MKRLILTTAFLLFSWQWPFAEQVKVTINKKTVYQAEVIKIQIQDKKAKPFTAGFLGRKYNSFLFGGRQTVLLGIHYQLKPGTYSIVLPEIDFVITVKEKYLRLPYKKPPIFKEEKKKSEQEREKEKIRRERLIKEGAEKRAVFSNLGLSLNEMKRFSLPFNLLLGQLSISDKFGAKRPLDNFGNRRYHRGTDFRGLLGKEKRRLAVLAINDGLVLLSSEYLLEGNWVVIDHGNGISSESLHLSRVFVKKGDWVKRGQPIGVVGESGSARGVHLHLTIKMDNGKTIIDPEKFFRLLN